MCDLGSKVTVWFTPTSHFPEKQEYRNVTELHFYFTEPTRIQLAVESDVHGTGCVLCMDDIREFETCLESEEATAF